MLLKSLPEPVSKVTLFLNACGLGSNIFALFLQRVPCGKQIIVMVTGAITPKEERGSLLKWLQNNCNDCSLVNSLHALPPHCTFLVSYSDRGGEIVMQALIYLAHRQMVHKEQYHELTLWLMTSTSCKFLLAEGRQAWRTAISQLRRVTSELRNQASAGNYSILCVSSTIISIKNANDPDSVVC